MKYLYSILVILSIVACTDYNSAQNKKFREDQRHYIVTSSESSELFYVRCAPAYALARNHTDSMIVHVLRPGDTYHGDPTCLEILQHKTK